MTGTTRGPAAAGVVLLAGLVVGTVAGCAPDAATGTAGTTTEKLTQGLPSTTAGSGTGSSARSSASPTDGPFGSDGPDASDTPDPALSDQPLPTLPSGDPGTRSPGASQHGSSRPVTAVPASALLDAATLVAVAGGDWAAAPAPAGWCASPRTPGSAASRDQLLTSTGGRLVQSVSAYGRARRAVRAVATATTRLQSCGFTVVRDPRLGEASELLTRTGADGSNQPDQTVVVLAAQGVGVVLLASGTPVAPNVWDSLVDLALGSSCAAAAEGCH
jgi:hypothetical protein